MQSLMRILNLALLIWQLDAVKTVAMCPIPALLAGQTTHRLWQSTGALCSTLNPLNQHLEIETVQPLNQRATTYWDHGLLIAVLYVISSNYKHFVI